MAFALIGFAHNVHVVVGVGWVWDGGQNTIITAKAQQQQGSPKGKTKPKPKKQNIVTPGFAPRPRQRVVLAYALLHQVTFLCCPGMLCISIGVCFVRFVYGQ